MTYGLIFIFALGLGLIAWIRLAPDDPARWHVALDMAGAPSTAPCVEAVRLVPQGAAVSCFLDTPPDALLSRLDQIATAQPRTTRLSGSPDTGRLTWVARSRLLGYPDYITAQTTQSPQGTRLDILSRQRYGQGDWGVNAARLQNWLSQL